ncbi:TonB-dependent receptor domain-containing protein [Sphingomonas sp.]|uniref:TonB-dependent receptor domain-containing protein n=1 Tax=Sphingomonas sp. TaxID=28214 RepID=UPI002DD6A9A4|nr:TonB-dependent receptor [Sphingomonas sp.]
MRDRLGLLGSISLVGILLATPALAQTAPEQADDGAASQAGEIVVTGSRLSSSNLSSAQPVVGVTADDIAKSGALTVADAARNLPQLGNAFGSTNQDISSANRGFNVGTELINLRNLGAQRTLVLVNGRRHIASDPGTSSVDLNTIPSAMIDRIEVVTGANSAVYGADAVSGVVNVILKNRFSGTAVNLRAGVTSEGDGAERAGSIIHGGAIGSALGYVVSAEYSKRDAIFGHDRDWVVGDGSSSAYTMGAGSSATGGGRFFTMGPTGTWTYPVGGGAPAAFTAATPLYQRVLDRNLQVPNERALVSGRLSYDLGGGTELFAEGTYARSSAALTIEPSFFQFAANRGPNAYDFGPIPTNAPGRAAFLAAAGATTINTAQTSSRRLTEYGVRQSIIDRDLYRIAVGAQGSLGGGFDYQAYYQFGRVDLAQEDTNSIDRDKFYAGMNACAGVHALPGCVPINIFGVNTISQQAIDWTVIPDVISRIHGKQHVASAFVSGKLFSLGGSEPVAVVVGAEYRSESTRADIHPSLTNGTNGTRQITAASGSTDVKEVFGELRVPLFGDLLQFGGAARLSDYDTVGSKFTWNVSGTFKPAAFVTFRASYGVATRAPGVQELYSPIGTSTSTLIDPCANDRSPQDGIADTGFTPPASCTAQLGAGYIVSQAPTGGAAGNRSGGNPLLDAETGKTLSAGAVFRVPSLLNFSGSIDYYDIRLTNEIGQLNPIEVVRQCYVDQPNLPELFCSAISRQPTGSRNINIVSTQLFNIAAEQVRGLDVQGRVSWPLMGGRMTFDVNYSRLFEHSRQDFAGGPSQNFTGRFDAVRDQLRAMVGVATDVVTVNYQTRVLGSALKGTSAANLAAVDNPALIGDNSNHIPAYVYHDIQLVFDAGPTTFTLGAKNLTDKKPPLITSFSNSGLSGSASITAGGIYDIRGRYLYAQIGVKF